MAGILPRVRSPEDQPQRHRDTETQRTEREEEEKRRGAGEPAPQEELPPVLVEVAGDGALDTVPGVAHGGLRLLPLETRVRRVRLPALAQLGLDLVELPALVAARGLPAVLVRRTVLVV